MTRHIEEPAALATDPYQATDTTEGDSATGSPQESTRLSDTRPQAHARARGRCEGCGELLDGSFDGTPEVHHRKLRSGGGSHDLINLLVLHRVCHEWAHAHPRQAIVYGWIVSRYFDPAQVPVVEYHWKDAR